MDRAPVERPDRVCRRAAGIFTGRRIFGTDAGLNAALVLGSSLLYVGIGHINTLDMGVTFFMTLGLSGFLLAQHSAATPRENRVWMHVTWAPWPARYSAKA